MSPSSGRGSDRHSPRGDVDDTIDDVRLSFGLESNDPDVIARALDPNGREVLLLSAPASSIDGLTGPILIPTFSSTSVIVVLAQEFVDRFVIADYDDGDMIRAKIDAIGKLVRESVRYGMSFLDGEV